MLQGHSSPSPGDCRAKIGFNLSTDWIGPYEQTVRVRSSRSERPVRLTPTTGTGIVVGHAPSRRNCSPSVGPRRRGVGPARVPRDPAARAWAHRLTLGFCVSMAVVCGGASRRQCLRLSRRGEVLPRLRPHGVRRGGIGGRPGEGGVETITLNRVATGLKVNLDERDLGKKDTLFDGKASGGNLSVGDTLQQQRRRVQRLKRPTTAP